ncbi:MAG: hypothetical protein DI571_13360 [Arsenicicoccus sp.]|nr:MAG: hypothetical protein DI571_13360 [Arsenicicoccus sp.]
MAGEQRVLPSAQGVARGNPPCRRSAHRHALPRPGTSLPRPRPRAARPGGVRPEPGRADRAALHGRLLRDCG